MEVRIWGRVFVSNLCVDLIVSFRDRFFPPRAVTKIIEALKASTLRLPIIGKALIPSILFIQLLMSCSVWRLPEVSDDELEIVRNAGVLLLQREIPDSINIQLVVDVLQAVKRAVVAAILDVGGMDTPS
ncbi:hypothetical protein Bca4012_009859 [Brassica carinata]